MLVHIWQLYLSHRQMDTMHCSYLDAVSILQSRRATSGGKLKRGKDDMDKWLNCLGYTVRR